MDAFGGRASVIGIGESPFYKHGGATDPEFVLCLKAILAACADADIDPRSIDGLTSFANDRNTSLRVANALGIKDLKWSAMQWGGGGGGTSGAVQLAAAGVACGFAERVVAYRSVAQGQFGRFGVRPRMAGDSYYAPHGIFGAPHSFALRMNRFIEQHGAGYEAQKAVARASYYHAQQNPHAVMHGRPLDEKTYDESRWIAEPFHLYDCCQENDAAAAVIIAPTEQARDLVEQPIPIIAAAQGNTGRSGGPIFEVYTADDWDTADFASPASRLFKQAGLTPQDMDFVQGYTNFTGGTVMAMVDHGFCAPSEVDKFLTFENLTAPNGMLPLNTAGGMAEVYVHGMELHVEAVRQLRGQSSNPVADAKYGLVFAGPMSPPVTTTIYARADAIG